ncbi:2Fe-2S iron-sulfur cluster-binding protein [Plantactinospora sp. WMMB334]|uniref:2Fe-2S iron-sulfur cluster-binding protein n=1 Tax=Plantactinospora sp. WMMB334 TaxID=3404119 RepID=UPI003B923DDA
MAMIRVDAHSVDVPPGSSLCQARIDSALPILFGCRVGGCGCCLVPVISGATNLGPATPREKRTLHALDAEPDWRLACQCVVLGDVRLRHV